MRTILSVLFFCLYFIANGQTDHGGHKYSFLTSDNTDSIYTEYKKGSEIKHGHYSVYASNGRLKVKGQFYNNQKNGIWTYNEYRGMNHIFSQYNWSDSTEVYWENLTPLGNRSKTILLKDDKWDFWLLSENVARFPGGTYVFEEYLNQEFTKITFPKRIRYNKKFYIQIIINENGSVDVYKYSNSHSTEYEFKDQELKKTLDQIFRNSPKWIPTLDGEKARKTMVSMLIKFY